MMKKLAALAFIVTSVFSNADMRIQFSMVIAANDAIHEFETDVIAVNNEFTRLKYEDYIVDINAEPFGEEEAQIVVLVYKKSPKGKTVLDININEECMFTEEGMWEPYITSVIRTAWDKEGMVHLASDTDEAFTDEAFISVTAHQS
jgi:hypothetical protein